MGPLKPEALAAWVAASCSAQGVAVKVRDAQAVARVRTLLSGPDARTGRRDDARPGGRSRLQAPDRVDPLDVKASRSRRAGGDHSVIQDGPNDGNLPVEVERRPLSA